MAGRDYTEQLNSVVESILEEYGLDTFKDYWNLSRAVIGNLQVRRFYVQAEPGYGNVAILTDDLLIDIEGENDEPPGSLSLHRISSISGVEFFDGPVADIPDTEEAQLVILAYAAGSEIVDLHWVAETEEEMSYLLLFGKALVEAITQE